MLNTSRVLTYIKDNLGFPFMHLELNDNEILEYVKNYTLREFSYYVPEVKRVNLNLLLAVNRVPGRENEYYITDEQGLEILNVAEIYPDMGQYLMYGHPPMGAFSHFELREFALGVATSMDVKMFSPFDITFEFMHPNKVRISPVPSNLQRVTVEYERMQNPDLSGVPNEFQVLFCEFALADIMVMLGRIRAKYENMRTPWGEIPIMKEIQDEGKEKKRELIEKLTLGPLMNVIIDHG